MTDMSQTLRMLHDTIPVSNKAVTGINAITTNYVNLVRLFGFSHFPGEQLTIEDAIKISAVSVCLDILAQDIAKTRLVMYRRLPNGGKQEIEAREHWLAGLLATEPNEFHTWYEFIEMVMLHLGIVQNAFVAKRQLRDGTVTDLIPIMPGRVRILADEDESNYVYEVKQETPHERILLKGFTERLLPDDMVHFRGRMFDGLYGYSNLEAGSKTFCLNNELVDFESRLYANDAQLRGAFQMPKEQTEPLPEEQFKRLRDQLVEMMGRLRDENAPLVLEQGLTFNPISMNASEAEVAKSRDAAIVDVARTFRIPPHKIFHLVNVKYENMETMEKAYVNETLIPYCQRLEQRLARSVLSRKERGEFFLQFDREAMTVTDVEKQSLIMGVMLGHGAMEIDEARQKRGLNALPGGAGKVRMIPSTFTVVDQSGEVVIAAGGQGDDAETPTEEDPDDEKGLPDQFKLKAVQ